MSREQVVNSRKKIDQRSDEIHAGESAMRAERKLPFQLEFHS